MTLSGTSSTTPPRPATIADWLAIPVERRAELIDGRVVYHSMPGLEHGSVQGCIAAALMPAYNRRKGGGERPGGWWISLEVDLAIGGLGCRPDLAGWRRDDHPKKPTTDARGLITVAPTWICEVLSPSTAAVDIGPKRGGYHRAGVEWYWITDPANRTITVLKRAEADYLLVAAAGTGERARLPPFDAIETDLNEVFSVEDDEPAVGG